MWAFPGDFFQLNADYFNAEKGMFSKLDIDQYIPEQWRLNQSALDESTHPDTFPVFVKPEWGQNSIGISRADDIDSFNAIRNEAMQLPYDHLIQEAAKETNEYEIFYLRKAHQLDDFVVMSITQARNRSHEKYPINSIESDQTWYTDISDEFSQSDKNRLWKNIGSIGRFKIARVCCRANSIEELISGQFHIVEINLFVPFPLYLQAENVSRKSKSHFIRAQMWNLAKLIKGIPKEQAHQKIFYRKWWEHIKMKSINK